MIPGDVEQDGALADGRLTEQYTSRTRRMLDCLLSQLCRPRQGEAHAVTEDSHEAEPRHVRGIEVEGYSEYLRRIFNPLFIGVYRHRKFISGHD